MSVREEVRRALAPDSAVDKAIDFLERIVIADGQGPARKHTAYSLRIYDRDDTEMMNRLGRGGFVHNDSLKHQVAYRITPLGQEAYERARRVKSSDDQETKKEDAIAPGEW